MGLYKEGKWTSRVSIHRNPEPFCIEVLIERQVKRPCSGGEKNQRFDIRRPTYRFFNWADSHSVTTPQQIRSGAEVPYELRVKIPQAVQKLEFQVVPQGQRIPFFQTGRVANFAHISLQPDSAPVVIDEFKRTKDLAPGVDYPRGYSEFHPPHPSEVRLAFEARKYARGQVLSS